VSLYLEFWQHCDFFLFTVWNWMLNFIFPMFTVWMLNNYSNFGIICNFSWLWLFSSSLLIKIRYLHSEKENYKMLLTCHFRSPKSYSTTIKISHFLPTILLMLDYTKKPIHPIYYTIENTFKQEFINGKTNDWYRWWTI
jgi:hypothetical protein